MTSNDVDEVAHLVLSGEPLRVGTTTTNHETSVCIQTGVTDEPIYMSPAEADLLIAALKVAKQRCEETNNG